MRRLEAEELVGAEWAEWHSLTPAERFAESMKLERIRHARARRP